MDLVVRLARFPSPGETVAGQGFATVPGGKGANQAAACARLGVATALVGRVGDDPHGEALLSALRGSGVDVSGVARTPGVPTGTAHIQVTAGGENTIVVVPGANHALDDTDLERLERALEGAAVLMLQLELPLPQVLAAARRAAARGVPVLLDPAPAQPLPDELWALCTLVTPNEHEAEVLTGLSVATAAEVRAAADAMRARGAREVIVKRAARGADWTDGETWLHVPAHRVEAVDTVAAGDAFGGGVAAALASGLTRAQALAWGAATAAVAVTRPGAQTSLPTRAEMLRMLEAGAGASPGGHN